MPHNGKLAYFLRYCSDPVMGLFNMQYEGELPALKPDQQKILKYKNMSYHFIKNEGYYEIQQVSSINHDHELYITFSPGLPDIIALKDGASTKGRFDIGVDDTVDLIQGMYQVRREGQFIFMEMYPDKNWKPRGSLLEKLTLFCFPPIFRTWVKTYRWKATIKDGGEPGIVTMKSSWRRTT
jgi:hypothetical protein